MEQIIKTPLYVQELLADKSNIKQHFTNEHLYRNQINKYCQYANKLNKEDLTEEWKTLNSHLRGQLKKNKYYMNPNTKLIKIKWLYQIHIK